MENISTVIKALFEKVDGDEVLKKAGYGAEKDDDPCRMDSDMIESTIVNRLLQVDKESTIDQVSMVGQLVQFKWMESDDSCMSLKFRRMSSVFNILLYFSLKCLRVKDGEPLCSYKNLLRWHLITSLVGEDLLTTSFLASRDLQLGKERKSFDWDAFIGHDCKELNSLFDRPMAELHMHLKGSSYNFDLSWLCMMNHIGIMQHNFEVEHPLHKYRNPDKDLYEKIKRAAAIRYYLAGAVGCLPETISLSQLQEVLWNDIEELIKKKIDKRLADVPIIDVQSMIDESRRRIQNSTKLKFEFLRAAQKFDDKLENQDIVDYIPVSHYGNELVENKALAPERTFMYAVFRKIYGDNNEDTEDIATLFYAYLLYKNYFRNEILQLNERVGFANFASYEERKTDYLLRDYDHILYKAAIEGFLQKNEKRFLEARIVPKDTEEGIVKSLQNICKEIDKKFEDRYDFIFHFIKKRDEPRESDLYRHFKLREEIKKQSYAIYQFRCNRDNWEVNNNLVGKVVGIDAANSEIFCRPEVYAQAFRFLRGHEIKIDEELDDYPYDLNVTYHVGEDFMDIADGLRAVEEALIFLNLRNGDRIGHALVLGTNVKEYYERRYNTICASRQVILDNLAWLHHKCIRLTGYTQLCGWLEIMFLKYFTEIYRVKQEVGENIIDSYFKPQEDNELSSNINDYYLSWLLRGDSPVIGKELDSENLKKLTSTIDLEWAHAGMNHQVCAEVALGNENARELFDAYHSFKYARRGYLGDTLTIPPMYREEWYSLLEKIQQHLIGKIEQRHVAIECNPSSNFKIGEISRYDEHPILKFFNYGLNTPFPHHDVAVSINTDDQGVFSTSLEREYSLMALAIERNQTEEHQNSPRAIVDWLDRVREMSIEQRFKYYKKLKNK